VIETPAGRAVEFDGVDDALVVDVHPLAGAETFTFYFKGAIRLARFTRRALAPSEFLRADASAPERQ
jgi:hypothetical protein